jgi:uncharacterized protein DUF4340
MKSELLKSLTFVLVAIVLVAGANWIEPEAATPEVLNDEGEPLFVEFRDVLDVKAIEVIGYDEIQAVATPLKVEFRENRWVMPSHNDYPAEAEDRLDKTAGALLGLKKDLVVSDRIEDHVTYGVVDPLDAKVTSLTGRGKRVTLRNEAGDVLADMILGASVEDHKGFRYMRLPEQKRVYGVKTDADPSARFEDWVESNLLRLGSARIRKITINSYSIDETMGRVGNSQRVEMSKTDGKWKAVGTRKVTPEKAAASAAALSAIRILGARTKPEPLAEQLRAGGLQMTLETVMSLRQRGYFLTQQGQLLSNEGEVTVETDHGVVCTLRFGEIVADTGVGQEAEDDEGAAPKSEQQDRYLFVTVRHDPEVAARYGGSGNGERTATFLNRKFADWYYVISGEDFAKIRAD